MGELINGWRKEWGQSFPLIRPSRDSDADLPQFWKAIDAYPPDHPREVKHRKVR